ncbi:MAG: HK97 family phage prohead protease [Bacillota bacterium]
MNFEAPIRQSFDAVVQSADKNERTITCVIVSSQTNRGRRKVDVNGCQYDDYLKSPVVLAFHDDERVIGRCMWLKFTEAGIVAKFEFRDSSLANDIYSLYKEGFLTSWSIGFLPVSWNYEEEDGQEIIHITKWVLLEVSAVSIPMDTNAITLAIDQGIVRDEYLIQSITEARSSSLTEVIYSNSKSMLDHIDKLKSEVSEAVRLWHSGINEIRLSFEGIKEKFDEIEKIISASAVLKSQSCEGNLSAEGNMNAYEFTEFTKELNDSIRQHIERLRGKL